MFQEGQKVTWTSQAGGFEKVKTGVIAQVVPPKIYPDRERFLHLYKNAGIGTYRDHESYVVIVGKRPYWPRVSQLRAVE